MPKFADTVLPYVNIHTHRPTGRGIELRTAGVHPWDAGRFAPEQIAEELAAALESGGVQAIGETGLDLRRGPALPVQRAALRVQLALACERDLPVVLHCVGAFEPLLHELAACAPRAVIFHGFIGSPEQARQALGRGYSLSYGLRTFASPKTLRALRETPLSQLFLETDDRPEPIEEVYARAAEALDCSVETLQRATLEQYERLFGPKHE